MPRLQLRLSSFQYSSEFKKCLGRSFISFVQTFVPQNRFGIRRADLQKSYMYLELSFESSPGGSVVASKVAPFLLVTKPNPPRGGRPPMPLFPKKKADMISLSQSDSTALVAVNSVAKWATICTILYIRPCRLAFFSEPPPRGDWI